MTQPPKKILICSGDESFFGALASSEIGKKYSLARAGDAAELAYKTYDEMPHLVLVDAHSSDIAALDACGQMKLDIIFSHIPLIVLTDSVRGSGLADCGVDLWLSKPVDMKELAHHVDRVIAEAPSELDINPLSHLAGNRSSVGKIEAAIETGRRFALCCIDLKNLRFYNEANGVRCGDFLIRETAGIIREAVAAHGAPDAFVGHLGGDDFVILTAMENAAKVAERIVELFDKSTHKFHEKIDREQGRMSAKAPEGCFRRHSFVCLSIAIVTNEWIGYRKVSEMTRTASQIQQYLKRFPTSAYLKDRRTDIRQPVSYFDVAPTSARKCDMEAVRAERRQGRYGGLIGTVLRYLRSGEVETFCQPIIGVGNGEVHGFEALSRFRDEKGNFLDPVLVFAAAREANVITEFDMLCAKRALLNNQGLPAGKKLFVNLNRETLMRSACIAEILADSPIPPDQIVFELTEQSLLTEVEGIVASAEMLRARGVKLAVDDMGGGSVSLREVANFRPDYIKFDGSLIRDVDTNSTKQRILQSLLVFARGIGAKTTAEGIETRNELEALKRAGLDFGQGFLIARPAKLNFASV